MPGHGPVSGLSRPFPDRDDPGDPTGVARAGTSRFPRAAAGAQMRGERAFELAFGLHEQRLVDRFVTHPHPLVVREQPRQRRGDLLR